jgi:glycerate-2-kinase
MKPMAAASAPMTQPGRSWTRARCPRARAVGLDPAAFLADNDSTGFFNAIGDLFSTGPTFTNVTDFRAIVVDSPGIRSRTVNRI